MGGTPVSEKTEQPTPRRLEQARRRGQVARSRSLASASSALFALTALAATAPAAAASFLSFARAALADLAASPSLAAWRAFEALASASLPVLGAGLAGALAGAGLQVGLRLSPEAVRPKLERLDPGAGFKRLFSARQLTEVLKAALIATAVLWLAWSSLKGHARVLSSLSTGRAEAALGATFSLAESFAADALLLAIAFGGLDFLLARRSHLKSLMMSRDEVKREHKESEGDPHHKARRKAAHRALMNGTAARGVKAATAVVVNPTHVAVALRYEPLEADAPTVVAKGEGEGAAKLRAEAVRLGVPMVRDIPLARALHRTCEVGEQIPEELFEAAAAVLQKAFELGAPLPPSLARAARVPFGR
jgi:type III secretion protein U